MTGERFAKHSKGIALDSFAHKDRGQLKQLAFVFFAYDIFASGLTPVGSRVESRAFCTLIIYVFQYYI